MYNIFMKSVILNLSFSNKNISFLVCDFVLYTYGVLLLLKIFQIYDLFDFAWINLPKNLPSKKLLVFLNTSIKHSI